MGCAVLSATASPAPAQDSLEPVTLLTDLSFPAGIAFGPDGAMYFTEREGRLRTVTAAGRLLPEPLAEFSTTTSGEAGALGLDFGDGALFVFVTDPDGTSNRIVRVEASSGAAAEIVEGLPGSGYHNGGGVVWDDGVLFVSNGETHDSARSQDPNALGGKVYRFTDTGEVPGDNPFGDSASFAIGLRNPFGMTMDPVSGALFVTENGPESHDEVNRVDAGGNYGWPDVSGPADPAPAGLVGEYSDPLLDYPEIIVPTGIAFAHPTRARPDVAGDLFFGSFNEGGIHQVELNDARDAALSDEIVVEEEEVVALAWGPRGLYYSTPDSIKVLPMASDKAPVRPFEQEETGFRLRPIAIAAGLLILIAAILLLLARRTRSRSQ